MKTDSVEQMEIAKLLGVFVDSSYRFVNMS